MIFNSSRLSLTIKRFGFFLKYFFLRIFKQPKFEVVVLTRFNTVSNFNNSELILDENYLNTRFHLFEKYYLPSLLNQSDKDFKIFVVLHPKTPKKFQVKLQQYEKMFEGRFKVVYNEEFLPDEILKKEVKTPWVASVRLDNDDALSEDYISNLKKCFSPISGTVIDFRFGAKYLDSKEKGFLYYYPYGSHFLVKIENMEKSPASVYSSMHSLVSKEVKYIKIKTKAPMWLEVIHNCNCGNELPEGLLELSPKFKKRFHIGEINFSS